MSINAHALIGTATNTTIVIASNSTWHTTIAVSGAAQFAPCLAAHDNHTSDDLVFSARVATTSQIHWMATNPTTGAISLTKGTMKVHVWSDDA